MALDFSKFLDVDIDSIPKVIPSIPVGHFFATIQGHKGAVRYYEGKGGPETPVVELTFKITAEDSDVENDGNIQTIGKIVTKDYNLPDGTGQTMLRNLAEDHLKLDTKGLHLSDVLDALKGQECKIYNEGRAGKEEGQFYPKITKVFGPN